MTEQQQQLQLEQMQEDHEVAATERMLAALDKYQQQNANLRELDRLELERQTRNRRYGQAVCFGLVLLDIAFLSFLVYSVTGQ